MDFNYNFNGESIKVDTELCDEKKYEITFAELANKNYWKTAEMIRSGNQSLNFGNNSRKNPKFT